LRDETARLLAAAVERLRNLSPNDPAAQAILRKIVRGYESDPKAWPKERLCAVADAHLFLGEPLKAEPIYRDVLEAEPNHRDALVGLGAVAMADGRFREAITNYGKARSLGCERALSSLAGCYLLAKDLDGMKDLVPGLLKQKADDLQALNSLVAYALLKTPKDKELFFKAIEGIPDGQILRRQDTANTVIEGLKLFGDKDHARRLTEMKARQDNGMTG
jgi:tetratricopeptide (TPR) repeat protein